MVSICDGLVYKDINTKKSLFIAAVMGIFQGIMPLIGFFIADLFYVYIKDVTPWISFSLLLIIGGKMFIEGILSFRKSDEEKEEKKFSYGQVLIQGIATSIDALAVGVSLLSISTKTTIYLHASIIILVTFAFCILGLFAGKFIIKLLKGKQEIATIIGGLILIGIGIEIVVMHYVG